MTRSYKYKKYQINIRKINVCLFRISFALLEDPNENILIPDDFDVFYYGTDHARHSENEEYYFYVSCLTNWQLETSYKGLTLLRYDPDVDEQFECMNGCEYIEGECEDVESY